LFPYQSPSLGFNKSFFHHLAKARKKAHKYIAKKKEEKGRPVSGVVSHEKSTGCIPSTAVCWKNKMTRLQT